MMGKHDLWPSGDYDEFERRLRADALVTFQNGCWWRHGFSWAVQLSGPDPFAYYVDNDGNHIPIRAVQG